MLAEYQLFWDEVEEVYYLQDCDGNTIGTLPDDIKFANNVLCAFNARLELDRLKDKVYDMKNDLNDFQKQIAGLGL